MVITHSLGHGEWNIHGIDNVKIEYPVLNTCFTEDFMSFILILL